MGRDTGAASVVPVDPTDAKAEARVLRIRRGTRPRKPVCRRPGTATRMPDDQSVFRAGQHRLAPASLGGPPASRRSGSSRTSGASACRPRPERSTGRRCFDEGRDPRPGSGSDEERPGYKRNQTSGPERQPAKICLDDVDSGVFRVSMGGLHRQLTSTPTTSRPLAPARSVTTGPAAGIQTTCDPAVSEPAPGSGRNSGVVIRVGGPPYQSARWSRARACRCSSQPSSSEWRQREGSDRLNSPDTAAEAHEERPGGSAAPADHGNRCWRARQTPPSPPRAPASPEADPGKASPAAGTRKQRQDRSSYLPPAVPLRHERLSRAARRPRTGPRGQGMVGTDARHPPSNRGLVCPATRRVRTLTHPPDTIAPGASTIRFHRKATSTAFLPAWPEPARAPDPEEGERA